MTTDTVALDQEVHELLSRLGVAEEKYAQGEIVEPHHGASHCARCEDDRVCLG
jgi:hypothetical protein